PLQLGRSFSRVLRKWRRLSLQDCRNYFVARPPLERRSPRDHLVKNYAKAEDIAPPLPILPTRLFRRHIPYPPQRHSGNGEGERQRDGGTERLRDRETEGRGDSVSIHRFITLSFYPSVPPSLRLCFCP